MIDITKILLKNGINGLANLDELYFKQNITQALAFKLDTSIKESYQACSEKLLHADSETKETPELKEFVNFIENFEEGKYEFKNNTHLNITDSDLNSVKSLFEALNPKNRQKMVEEIFQGNLNFKKHVDFYNNSKGLLK